MSTYVAIGLMVTLRTVRPPIWLRFRRSALAGKPASRWLGRISHPAASRQRWLLFLIAYIDPSGDPDDPTTTHLGLAGYISHLERWEAFEGEWNAVLEANGLKERGFHMTDCEFGHADGSLHKDYRHKSAAHWLEVKKELAGIIERHTDSGFGAAFDLPAFRAVMVPHVEALAPEYPWMLRMADPLAVALQIFVGRILKDCHKVVRPGEVIKIICDNENSGPKGRLMDAYEHVRTLFRWEGWLDETLGFESSRRFVPLQAADILSYEVRKSILNRDVRPRRKLLDVLANETEAGGRIEILHCREEDYRELVERWPRLIAAHRERGS